MSSYAESFADLSTYPRFFLVDDVLVKLAIDPEDDLVYGSVVLTGAPYSWRKAIAEGYELSAEDAERFAAGRSTGLY